MSSQKNTDIFTTTTVLNINVGQTSPVIAMFDIIDFLLFKNFTLFRGIDLFAHLLEIRNCNCLGKDFLPVGTLIFGGISYLMEVLVSIYCHNPVIP